jgi:hypothetical protein
MNDDGGCGSVLATGTWGGSAEWVWTLETRVYCFSGLSRGMMQVILCHNGPFAPDDDVVACY